MSNQVKFTLRTPTGEGVHLHYSTFISASGDGTELTASSQKNVNDWNVERVTDARRELTGKLTHLLPLSL